MTVSLTHALSDLAVNPQRTLVAGPCHVEILHPHMQLWWHLKLSKNSFLLAGSGSSS